MKNIKSFTISMLCLLPMLAIAQFKGIEFKPGVTWTQVKEKARAENKYIFLDCFTTWCGPCKQMDMEVYPDSLIGDFMNKNFIAMKVQLDTSKNDNENVKTLYADASEIKKTFNITGYPTLLFFSPKGELVERDLGVLNKQNFLSLAEKTLNPDEQIFLKQLDDYKMGNRDYAVMLDLGKRLINLGEDSLGHVIAEDYLNNYVYKLDEKYLYTKANLDLIGIYSLSVTDKGFQMLVSHPRKVDSVMKQRGYSRMNIDYKVISYLFQSGYFKRLNNSDKRPNWQKLYLQLKKQFGNAIASRNVLNAKMSWYSINNDWANLIKCYVEKIEKFGLLTDGLMAKMDLNNTVYYLIFMHSNDKVVLNKAIKWMEILLQRESNHSEFRDLEPEAIDTYAGLLYKTGRTRDAIEQERKAEALDKKRAKKNKSVPDPIYREVLVKMEKGVPTWTNVN